MLCYFSFTCIQKRARFSYVNDVAYALTFQRINLNFNVKITISHGVLGFWGLLALAMIDK